MDELLNRLCESESVAPFTDEAFAAWRAESGKLDSVLPVFIVGPQRTGTTWLTIALNQHPEIVAKMESNVVWDVFKPMLRAISEYNAKKRRGKHSVDHLIFHDRDLLPLCRQFIDCQLLNYLAVHPEKRPKVVADKSPNHTFYAGLLAKLYPRAKFILCLRDVRDAAVSQWFLDVHAGVSRFASIAEMAIWYAEHVYSPGVRAARAAAAAMGSERMLEIKYEEHLERPIEELERVCRFLGVDDDRAIAEQMHDRSSFKKLSGRDRGEEANSFYRKGVAGDWRNHFSDEFGERLLKVVSLTENDPAWQGDAELKPLQSSASQPPNG